MHRTESTDRLARRRDTDGMRHAYVGLSPQTRDVTIVVVDAAGECAGPLRVCHPPPPKRNFNEYHEADPHPRSRAPSHRPRSHSLPPGSGIQHQSSICARKTVSTGLSRACFQSDDPPMGPRRPEVQLDSVQSGVPTLCMLAGGPGRAPPPANSHVIGARTTVSALPAHSIRWTCGGTSPPTVRGDVSVCVWDEGA